MLSYANIIQQKREERKKYIDQLNTMRDTHDINGLKNKYALEFQDCIALLGKMRLFAELENPDYPPFSSKDEYITTRLRLAGFTERKIELLDAAATIYTYEENIRRCNALFEKSILDESSYIPGQNDSIYALTKQLLKTANDFGKYLTPEFLFAISVSAVESLSESDILSLVENGFITEDDIEKMLDIQGIEDKIARLSDTLGIQPPITETHEIKLKGVTYANEDGSSKQEYLKELSNATNKEISIVPYIFHNPKNNQDEPAAKVMWGEKCIGNLPASFMIELDDRFKNVSFSAELDRVVGGNDFNYGCYIHLTVTGRPKNKPHKINLAQFTAKNLPAEELETQESEAQAELQLS